MHMHCCIESRFFSSNFGNLQITALKTAEFQGEWCSGSHRKFWTPTFKSWLKDYILNRHTCSEFAASMCLAFLSKKRNCRFSSLVVCEDRYLISWTLQLYSFQPEKIIRVKKQLWHSSNIHIHFCVSTYSLKFTYNNNQMLRASGV